MRMGIGITGYLQSSSEQKSWLRDTYDALREFDVEYSRKNNFPTSIKLTTVKPSGTLSLLAGVTPGVHPGYSEYHIRRVRIRTEDPLTELAKNNGYHVEYVQNFDGTENYDTSVISFPCKFPKETVVAAAVSAVQQLEYVKELQTNWSDNSVSCTVYYKKEELPAIKQWLTENYENSVKTVSFLLHSDHGFKQAPIEEITKETYEAMVKQVKPLGEFSTSHTIDKDLECAGGSCPVI